jgi:hypothetical protein
VPADIGCGGKHVRDGSAVPALARHALLVGDAIPRAGNAEIIETYDLTVDGRALGDVGEYLGNDVGFVLDHLEAPIVTYAIAVWDSARLLTSPERPV